jgi:hypothetical protein
VDNLNIYLFIPIPPRRGKKSLIQKAIKLANNFRCVEGEGAEMVDICPVKRQEMDAFMKGKEDGMCFDVNSTKTLLMTYPVCFVN